MSQADVETLRALATTVAEGDATAWLRAMDPAVRVYPRSEEPGVRAVYDGWDGVMEYMVNWYSQWEDYEVEPLEFLDAGDQVLVVIQERGRMDREGLNVTQEFSHSFKLREGLVVEWRMYDSHEQALEAVGLSE
ncbi:MAG TPA: nuclear transport factor 2 family protein [Thermoleophilaceae bacterium]|nr:nuclear transport factor 2 family protein [Thermoleophilaceae bacterium]